MLPVFEPDWAEALMWSLLQFALRVFYRVKSENRDYNPDHNRELKAPHNKALCEGCQRGLCSESHRGPRGKGGSGDHHRDKPQVKKLKVRWEWVG